MWKKIKSIISQEEGLGTVEIIIIVAVLVGIALIFRTYIFEFVQDIMGKIFSGEEVNQLRTNPTQPPLK